MSGCPPPHTHAGPPPWTPRAGGGGGPPRRGGGGYIRITRMKDEGLVALLRDRVDPHEVPALLARLETEGWLSRTEILVLRESLGEVLAEEDFDPGVARARMLRAVLLLLGRRGKEKG